MDTLKFERHMRLLRLPFGKIVETRLKYGGIVADKFMANCVTAKISIMITNLFFSFTISFFNSTVVVCNSERLLK